jgi:hypothetical protein
MLGNSNHRLGTGVLMRIQESKHQLRVLVRERFWYDIVLSVHASTEDDKRHSFYEELQCVFESTT